MSDRDMRQLLREVMADIEEGRVPKPRPRRSRLTPWLFPPLLAASLGLAACDDRSVGTSGDATVPTDAITDTGPTADAIYAAPPVDAAMDTGVSPPYMAPPFDAGPGPEYGSPFDAGPEPDYASPFDATVDDGAIPVYLAPPPADE